MNPEQGPAITVGVVDTTKVIADTLKRGAGCIATSLKGVK
jgi:hypothetical protein